MSDRILIVDDEESIRYTFSAFLTDAGYQVSVAENLEEARTAIARDFLDAIFLDILLGRDSGITVLAECRSLQPHTPVIMVTGAPEIQTAAEAVRLGAFDYITKPIHQDELLRLAKLAVEHKHLIDQREAYQLRMAAVFQSVHEGIMVFDEEMKLLEINDAATRLLSCDKALIGLHPGEITRKCPPLGVLQALIENRCEGEIYHVEAKSCSGVPLAFSLTMAPLTGQGERELGNVLVIRDENLPGRQLDL